MNKTKLICFIIAIILLLWLVMPVKESKITFPTFLKIWNDTADIVYVHSHPCNTLDPAFARENSSALIISNIYEGLVKSTGTIEVEPSLATSWQVSADGLEWTFELREDVKFHDGTPFNAQAVKINVERQLQNNGEMTYAPFVFGLIKKVEVIDQYKVLFSLYHPYSPLLKNLAMPFAAPIVSPNALKTYGDDFWKHPSGTGPFELKKWSPESVLLTSNHDYWGQRPSVESIAFLTIPSEVERVRMLQNGKAHIATNINMQNAQMLQKQKFIIHQTVGLDISYLGFYTNKEPFSNIDARQAFNLALDRIKLVRESLNGQGIPATSYLPPKMIDNNVGVFPTDHSKAKELISTIFSNKDITLITYEGSRPYNPAGGETLAHALARQMACVGLVVNIKSYPWEEFKKALNNQEGDAFLYGWISDNGDPDNLLYPLFSSAHINTGLNAGHYKNNELDTLLASAQRTSEQPLRLELYKRVLDILERDIPCVPINHSMIINATCPSITGYKPNPSGWDDLSRITIDKS